MSDGPEWFVPKRYGYGATPITWQGWALTLGFTALSIALVILLKDNRLQMIAVFVPLTLAFMIICARTTRGGWRWRWGEED
jgi:hypothetical protein